MGRRRKARECALQLLFRLELSGEGLDWASFSDFWKEAEVDEEVEAFARDIVSGAWERREEIDRLIDDAAEHWAIDRFASVDRALLRIGVYELRFREDIPPSVTINEALEIAKKFSTAESASFINGILDRLSRSAP